MTASLRVTTSKRELADVKRTKEHFSMKLGKGEKKMRLQDGCVIEILTRQKLDL